MGYERDEAMRQQEATEAMIRMREPRRPSEGPFMPCPAKGLITVDCEIVYEQTERLRISGRIWTLTLCDEEDRRRQIEYIRVENSDGEQVGEVASRYQCGAFALSADNCKLLSMFLVGDHDGITEHMLASIS